MTPPHEAQPDSPADHARLMDGIYRYQRYIYDITRKYFLLGRDRLIEQMQIKPGMRVLEIGCGTGRNLMCLVKRHPEADYYGLDASEEMLVSARAKIAHRRVDNVHVTQCLAEDLDYKKTFELAAPFDVAFFSYTLTMIPTWQDALISAFENLKPGSPLLIVDFWDQADLPGWFRWILKRWLALFHVHHKKELIDCLQALHDAGCIHLTIESLHGRYAYLAEVTEIKVTSKLTELVKSFPANA